MQPVRISYTPQPPAPVVRPRPSPWLIVRLLTWVLDHLFPRSPVSGNRQLMPIPHLLERGVGYLASLEVKYFSQRSIRVLELHAADNPALVTRSAQPAGRGLVPAARSAQAVFTRLKRVAPQWPKSVWDLWPSKNRWDWNLVVESRNELNAYAMPGGQIVLWDGLLQTCWDQVRLRQRQGNWVVRTAVEQPDGTNRRVEIDMSSVRYEDVVAGLEGHEMTHVAARHGFFLLLLRIVLKITIGLLLEVLLRLVKQRQTVQGQQLLNGTFDLVESMVNLLSLGRSRAHEYEADRFGAKLALRAGYNPLGAIALYDTFRQLAPRTTFFHRVHNLFQTHPLSEDRVSALAANLLQDPEMRRSIQAR